MRLFELPEELKRKSAAEALKVSAGVNANLIAAFLSALARV